MWIYKDKEFTEDDIKNHFGFVYCITNLNNNKKYIGKKFFTKSGRKQTKGKVKKIRVSSDWMDYYGSNKTLQEEVDSSNKIDYRREILYLCKTRSECSYYESYEIFVRNALISDQYYNDWVSCRVRRSNLKSIIKPEHQYL
jgi:hypothetical protein